MMPSSPKPGSTSNGNSARSQCSAAEGITVRSTNPRTRSRTSISASESRRSAFIKSVDRTSLRTPSGVMVIQIPHRQPSHRPRGQHTRRPPAGRGRPRGLDKRRRPGRAAYPVGRNGHPDPPPTAVPPSLRPIYAPAQPGSIRRPVVGADARRWGERERRRHGHRLTLLIPYRTPVNAYGAPTPQKWAEVCTKAPPKPYLVPVKAHTLASQATGRRQSPPDETGGISNIL